MSRKEIFYLAKYIFEFTSSICIGVLLQMFVLSINMHFVGRMENPIFLDSIGFAIVIINCTGGYLLLVILLN